jgi:hypothetical protein
MVKFNIKNFLLTLLFLLIIFSLVGCSVNEEETYVPEEKEIDISEKEKTYVSFMNCNNHSLVPLEIWAEYGYYPFENNFDILKKQGDILIINASSNKLCMDTDHEEKCLLHCQEKNQVFKRTELGFSTGYFMCLCN